MLCGVVLIAVAAPAAAQRPTRATFGPARIREYSQTFPTYPFSDPNPIAITRPLP